MASKFRVRLRAVATNPFCLDIFAFNITMCYGFDRRLIVKKIQISICLLTAFLFVRSVVIGKCWEKNSFNNPVNLALFSSAFWLFVFSFVFLCIFSLIILIKDWRKNKKKEDADWNEHINKQFLK